jgi:hypothetical protein
MTQEKLRRYKRGYGKIRSREFKTDDQRSNDPRFTAVTHSPNHPVTQIALYNVSTLRLDNDPITQSTKQTKSTRETRQTKETR